MLSGKWVWIWNWRRCLDGDPQAVARRLRDAGCRGAFVKSDDGGHPFDQGRPVWEIVHALQQEGLRAGCWGYVYGCDTPTAIYGDLKRTASEEAATAARFITERPHPSYRGPDVYVIDVESEYERYPSDPGATAERYLQAIRDAAGPGFPLLYAPLAQPDCHRRLPYGVFNRYCRAVMPQAYHNAMGVSPERAVELCYDAFRREGLDTLPIAPAGGAYGSVTPEELERWAKAAVERGARMLSWWSFEHIERERPRLWDAIARVELPPDEEDQVDEEARRRAQENAFRQRIAGLILSGDASLAEQAYREMQYVRALAGLRPLVTLRSDDA
ncbi:MAG: hypothetical protein QME71_03575 [Dehalococcoidia bacterium]|nr:hypothetical protein [Dehalococcoidia bacterium]